MSVRDRDLKSAGRDRVDEFLIDKARSAIRKAEIQGAEQMLDSAYGLKTAVAWVKAKFGIELDISEVQDLENDEVIALASERAIEKYGEKEVAYPVMAGLYKFVAPASGGATGRMDREGLVEWASRRFNTDLSVDDLRNKQRDEVHELLVDKSRASCQEAVATIEQLQQTLKKVSDSGGVPLVQGNGAAKDLSNWFKEKLDYELPLERYERLEQEELEQKLEAIVEDHFHPEFRRMERMVLLEIVDSAWKDHLLAMDYLRSAVSQRGIAQLDPKVEYKREGMRMFDGLWTSIGERVTDLVFRMEQLNESFVSHTLTETTAIHEDPDQAAPPQQNQGGDGQSQSETRQNAADRAGKKRRVETIRNREKKIGRNDPCSCGSGKKYKTCCLRKQ